MVKYYNHNHDNGNLTIDENDYKYTYDYENRLIKIEKYIDPTGYTSIATYQYDALGRRIKVTIGQSTKYCFYDTKYHSPRNPLDQPNSTYIWILSRSIGIDSPLLADNASANDYFYIANHQNSSLAIYDLSPESLTTLEYYHYDAYGKTTCYDSTYTNSYSISNYNNNLLYHAQMMDSIDSASLLLYAYRYRTYSPTQGRFFQHDKLGTIPADNENINPFEPLNQYSDSMSLYEYLTSDPINNTDDYGLSIIGSAAAATISAAASTTAACIATVVTPEYFSDDWTNDKYGHCIVSCKISKVCGKLASKTAGFLKEVGDALKYKWGFDKEGYSAADMLANKDGQDCAGKASWIPLFGLIKKESCECCCCNKGYDKH